MYLYILDNRGAIAPRTPYEIMIEFLDILSFSSTCRPWDMNPQFPIFNYMASMLHCPIPGYILGGSEMMMAGAKLMMSGANIMIGGAKMMIMGGASMMMGGAKILWVV